MTPAAIPVSNSYLGHAVTLMSFQRLAVTVLLAVPLWLPPALSAAPAGSDDGVAMLLARLEGALLEGSAAAYLGLLDPSADLQEAREFAEENLRPGLTRAVVRERDRARLDLVDPARGERLLVEIFTEQGARGRIVTWRLDVLSSGSPGAAGAWRIVGQERVSGLDGLHRLSLGRTRQYAIRDLTVTAEDLTLKMSRGAAFAVEIEEGVTGLVLRGRGEMIFAPAPASEQTQVRIFSGQPNLRAAFTAAYIRVNPIDLRSRVSMGSLVEREVDQRELRRALQIFDEHVGRSFVLDLGELSRDTWSLVPPAGDFLAEIHTRRHGTLTYARSGTEAEDISLFDRRQRRNISVYASAQKLAVRGRFYNEDDLADYDVQQYNVTAGFWPDRGWVEGFVTLRLRVRAHVLGTLTLRLAESLAVRSVTSDELGRLLHLRVRGQNSVIVNLPAPLVRNQEISITVSYAGRLVPQGFDREALAAQVSPFGEGPVIPVEPRYVYSTRTHWYPQSPVSDYATATLRLTVPADYGVVASGELAEGMPIVIGDAERSDRKMYVFVAREPVRYLACVISRFTRVDTASLLLQPGGLREDPAAGDAAFGSPARSSAGGDGLRLAVSIDANPRQQGRARDLPDRLADVFRFYTAIIGDVPYPSFALAVTESDLPGGHSPAYFAVLNQPLPMASTLVWANDPASFPYPHFFLAHELAHQWWGQAVGWKNYREQWLSEGFAQYFAALYARHDRGEDTFTGILRHMRRSAMEASDQGPVHLGYRLGHIKGQSRVFRSLVYNKGAAVLHTLRRLIGDEAFFAGVRRYYREMRFSKAGTDDLQAAMEIESGRSLERFFDRWIFNDGLPRVAFSHRLLDGDPQAYAADGLLDARPERPSVLLRFEQHGEIYDVPITVTLTDATGASRDVIVPVTDRLTERYVALDAPLRRVDVNRDHAALAHITR
jgi:hypothetical protein